MASDAPAESHISQSNPTSPASTQGVQTSVISGSEPAVPAPLFSPRRSPQREDPDIPTSLSRDLANGNKSLARLRSPRSDTSEDRKSQEMHLHTMMEDFSVPDDTSTHHAESGTTSKHIQTDPQANQNGHQDGVTEEQAKHILFPASDPGEEDSESDTSVDLNNLTIEETISLREDLQRKFIRRLNDLKVQAQGTLTSYEEEHKHLLKQNKDLNGYAVDLTQGIEDIHKEHDDEILKLQQRLKEKEASDKVFAEGIKKQRQEMDFSPAGLLKIKEDALQNSNVRAYTICSELQQTQQHVTELYEVLEAERKRNDELEKEKEQLDSGTGMILGLSEHHKEQRRELALQDYIKLPFKPNENASSGFLYSCTYHHIFPL